MTRRPKGDGSITELPNGKFRVRIEIRPDGGDKRKWVSKTVGSISEARSVLKELERQKADNKLIATKKENFKDIVEMYLKELEESGEVKETTQWGYKMFLSKWLPYLEAMPVQKITSRTLDKIMQDWKTQYGVNSILSYRRALSCLFTFAIKKKLISRSPLKDIKRIKNVSTKKYLEIISPEEHEQIKRITYGDFKSFLETGKATSKTMMFPIYMLAYETGMRRGEIAALKWSSVDFKQNTIFVESNMVHVAGKGTLETTPKTESSVRPILVSEALLELLRTIKDTYERFNIKATYLFVGQKHTCIIPSQIGDNFKEIKEKAGITRPLTFHDIRHTNATILLTKGFNTKVISTRLGHSNIAITLDTYSHVLNATMQSAVGFLEEQSGHYSVTMGS